MGWLTGFEPVLKEPQSSVLPLHHSHHASQAGFEPAATGLEGRCSIQLSYWDKYIKEPNKILYTSGRSDSN